MAAELNTTEQEDPKKHVQIQSGSSGTVYGLGMIGAWIYFIGRAATTQERIQGFLKGIVWPAILVYKVLERLEKE